MSSILLFFLSLFVSNFSSIAFTSYHELPIKIGPLILTYLK